ncbi:MAG: radical SAM protein [Candidatus Firestonebacteria bacterium]
MLRLIFWELTRACNLACPHCRASAIDHRTPDELTTNECFKVLDSVVAFSKPLIILSGGEPLIRSDIFDIINYGKKLGLNIALASNATLITEEIAIKLKTSGISRVAISVYGPNENVHDTFIGKNGAFKLTFSGIENLKKAGLPFQFNFTVTKKNVCFLEEMIAFAQNSGAVALHPFFLVPTGRGKEMSGDALSPVEHENALELLCKFFGKSKIELKITCAPHHTRILHQSNNVQSRLSKGCLAGSAVCFTSYKGEVYPCGYFQLAAGNLRNESLQDIWNNSKLFLELRDDEKLTGKCGICEFKTVCGGCRARAYAETGNYLKEEPYCIYGSGERIQTIVKEL